MHVQGNDGWESAGEWFRQVFWRVAAGILVVVALPGCRASNVKGGTMNLTSTSFQGNQIPAKFTCNGAGISPQLSWSEPPAGTASFTLIVTDPDALGRTFVHWVIYDLPAEMRELLEGMPGLGQLTNGSRQGHNDFGEIGYGGPCPPGNSAHHYHFALYALDAKLNLPTGAARAQVEAAMQGHILARGKLIGLYQR
jgi:Raf kinase inhibitor-like YbhB/YbcL family protein